MNYYFLKWITYLNKAERKDFLNYIKPAGKPTKWYEVIRITVKVVEARIDILSETIDDPDKEILDDEENENEWSITLEEIAFKVYKNKKATGKVSKVFSERKPYLDDFIILQEIRENEILRERSLANAAQKRGFHKGYKQHQKNRKNANEQSKNRSFSYWEEAYLANYLQFFHPETEKNLHKYKLENKNYQPEKALQNIWNNHRLNDITITARLACELMVWLNWKNVQHFDNFSLEEVKALRNVLPKHEKEFCSATFYLDLLDKIEVVDSDFLDLINQYKKNIDCFSPEEQSSIFHLFFNLLAFAMLNPNDKTRLEARENYLNLVRFVITKPIYTKANQTTTSTFFGMFMNIVNRNVALAEKLIYEYIHIVPFDEQKLTFKICETELFLEKGEHDKSYNMIKEPINTTLETFVTRYEVARIKAAYEVRENHIHAFESFDLAKSFKRSLQETESRYALWNDQIKQILTNFCTAVMFLNEDKIDQVEELLDSVGYLISSKTWILKKIIELKETLPKRQR